MLANLYVVGAPKAGTTSLCDWLAQHPDIAWSVPKEPYYWASDFPGMRRHYGFDDRPSYEGLFDSPRATAARYRGDGSTTYLYSQTAIVDIEAMVPDARYIVCLRDPVSLVRSFHRTQLTALNETEPEFQQAWRRSLSGEPAPAAALDPKLLDYQLIGSQGARLGALLDLVPQDRVHIVVFDDLVRSPETVWTGVCAFLDLPSEPAPAFAPRNASDKAARSKVLRRLTHRPPAFMGPAMARLRQWSRTTDSRAVRRVKRWMWVPTDRPAVDSALDDEVHRYFADDVTRLGVLVDRDLAALWALPQPPPA